MAIVDYIPAYQWSNTKWANLIKRKFGIPTPVALSMKGWDEYTEKYGNHIVMKLFDVLDEIQSVVFYPTHLYNKFASYVRNRFVHKTHYLKTNLDVGRYHEFEDRILHGMFNEFVNFIQMEKGYVPRKHLFDRGGSGERAMEYLNWEINECENPKQAEQARWELDAYNWWVYKRPYRPDPYEESGLTRYYEANGFFSQESANSELSQELGRMGRKCDEIQRFYHEEDTKWMIELIERRSNIWT